MRELLTRKKRTPTYFITAARKVEPVGDDIVRIYCSIARNGEWEDQVELLMPISSVLTSSQFVMNATKEIAEETELLLDVAKN